MKQQILLAPVEMTKAVMIDLENRGFIIRLAPGSRSINAKAGETLCETIYKTGPKYGGHKLMYIEVNRMNLPEFGTHPENEDFYFISHTGEKQLYLVMALCFKDELNDKIKNDKVTASDFIALKVKHNDADVSFFTILKDVPHGEAVGSGEGRAGSFYVTESSDLIDVDTQFGNYELQIKN